jgi:colicin import membrane protein
MAALKEQQKIAAETLKKSKAAAEEAAVKLKKQKDDEAKALKQKQQYEAAAALQKQIATKQAAIAQQRSEAINGIVDQYKGLILEAISKNWLVPPGADPKLACQLVITLGASGQVMNVQVVKGSGNALLDQSAVAAVYKASPLPVPDDADAAALFKQFSLTLKPEQFVDM